MGSVNTKYKVSGSGCFRKPPPKNRFSIQRDFPHEEISNGKGKYFKILRLVGPKDT